MYVLDAYMLIPTRGRFARKFSQLFMIVSLPLYIDKSANDVFSGMFHTIYCQGLFIAIIQRVNPVYFSSRRIEISLTEYPSLDNS